MGSFGIRDPVVWFTSYFGIRNLICLENPNINLNVIFVHFYFQLGRYVSKLVALFSTSVSDDVL